MEEDEESCETPKTAQHSSRRKRTEKTDQSACESVKDSNLKEAKSLQSVSEVEDSVKSADKEPEDNFSPQSTF